MTSFRICWSDGETRDGTDDIYTTLAEAQYRYMVDAGHLDDDSMDAVDPELSWQLGWNDGKRNVLRLYADGRQTDVSVEEVTEAPTTAYPCEGFESECVSPGRFEVVTTFTGGLQGKRPTCLHHGLDEVTKTPFVIRRQLIDLQPSGDVHVVCTAEPLDGAS